MFIFMSEPLVKLYIRAINSIVEWITVISARWNEMHEMLFRSSEGVGHWNLLHHYEINPFGTFIFKSEDCLKTLNTGHMLNTMFLVFFSLFLSLSWVFPPAASYHQGLFDTNFCCWRRWEPRCFPNPYSYKHLFPLNIHQKLCFLAIMYEYSVKTNIVKN